MADEMTRRCRKALRILDEVHRDMESMNPDVVSDPDRDDIFNAIGVVIAILRDGHKVEVR